MAWQLNPPVHILFGMRFPDWKGSRILRAASVSGGALVEQNYPFGWLPTVSPPPLSATPLGPLQMSSSTLDPVSVVSMHEKGAEAPSDSEKSFFGHAKDLATCNNQMVKHPYFDELQCIAQSASD